jgi:hypothetical protein
MEHLVAYFLVNLYAHCIHANPRRFSPDILRNVVKFKLYIFLASHSTIPVNFRVAEVEGMLGLAQEQTNNIRRQNLSYLDRHVVRKP